MKTILVTGVSGFIGAHMAERFLGSGYKVIAPVRQKSLPKIERLTNSDNFSAISGNFYDQHLLERISENIDVILHFASIRGEGGGDDNAYQKINIDGTRHLLEYAKTKKVPRFIYCSSVGVFGTIPENQPAGINQQVEPDNLYHNSKWQSEQLVNSYNSSGLKTCVLRPTITYGSGDDGFIPKLIDMLKSKKFPLSSKNVHIHLLDVKAFAELVFSLVEEDKITGKTYIVADKSPVSLRQLVGDISQSLGNSSGFINVPSFMLDLAELGLKVINKKKLLTSIQLINQNWTYRIDETIKDLGYQPSTTLAVLDQYIKEKRTN